MKLRTCPTTTPWLTALLIMVGIISQQQPTIVAQTTTNDPSADLNCVAIERSLPPIGLDIDAEQATKWMSRLRILEQQAKAHESEFKNDVQVLLKACRMAIEFQELYVAKDFAKVDRVLELAATRLAEIAAGQASWSRGSGRQLRGFRSQVDGSVQPVGLILPDNWQRAAEPLPLYVWLHGRGDKSTDLHFICERLDKDGQITPQGAIVVHPFGRQCVGYKSAGETDVMEAIDFVCANYPVDQRRIVLMGFSMGGAGVWHLAAHYGQRFVAASAGAGFAETARYQNLKPEQFPVKYEQILWSIYDVPGYTQNLFNLPFVAYSGELDKQIQAARVMEEAFSVEGRHLPHLIGPGMGHKYHPNTLAELMQRMADAAKQGQPLQPTELFLQTKHPRYSQRSWLAIDGPIEQYADTRATAMSVDNQWTIKTKNVARLIIDASIGNAPQRNVKIDDISLNINSTGKTWLQRSGEEGWKSVDQFSQKRKAPGLSGPIDDAFIDPFLVVMPSGKSSHERVNQWVRCESQNLSQRWQMLFRGSLRTKLDQDVTADDMSKYHLLLWGDPQSNSVMRRIIQKENEDAESSIAWTADHLTVGPQKYNAANHVLLAIRPNPLAPSKYAVMNSGPTFRQAHDRTNSLQNPHLPDWAVISLDEAPSANRPGKVQAAGFFSDSWVFDPNMSW